VRARGLPSTGGSFASFFRGFSAALFPGRLPALAVGGGGPPAGHGGSGALPTWNGGAALGVWGRGREPGWLVATRVSLLAEARGVDPRGRGEVRVRDACTAWGGTAGRDASAVCLPQSLMAQASHIGETSKYQGGPIGQCLMKSRLQYH
jgi:hypothetical protein